MKHYQHILCPTDYSVDSDQACIRALELAQESGAKLTLLHVVGYFPEDRPNDDIAPEDVDPKTFHEQRSRAKLEEQAVRTGCREAVLDVTFSTHSAAHEIVRYAKAGNVDLLVMASHAHSAFAELFGTTSGGVELHAPCEVLILPPSKTK